MNLIISMLSGFLIIGAFCFGICMGYLLFLKEPDRKKTAECSQLEPVVLDSDHEKELILAQQKALEQCMSYSVDMAYGIKSNT